MSLFSREPTVPLSFHDASMAAERARYDALFEKYAALKLAGAVEVPKHVEQNMGIQPIEHRNQQPDELRELIDAKAGGNLAKRRMMLRQLAADRAAGLKEETIREAIENGVPSEGVPNG